MIFDPGMIELAKLLVHYENVHEIQECQFCETMSSELIIEHGDDETIIRIFHIRKD